MRDFGLARSLPLRVLMTPALTRVFGACLLFLSHVTLGNGNALPANAGSDIVDGAADGCTYGGQIHAVGSTFPSTDGCNECKCSAGGQVACTKKGCLPLVGCSSVAGAYEYGAVGGMVAWSSRAFLLGGARYKYQRTYYLGPRVMTASCSPDIPPCTADAEVTPPAINKAFAHGDVQKAFELKTPMFYGRDTRPVDGMAFEVKRTWDGHSFLIGSPCSTPPVVEQACTEIPPGLTVLRELLLKLDQQQLGHPLCQAAIKN